jgi:hypothetical protein
MMGGLWTSKSLFLLVSVKVDDIVVVVYRNYNGKMVYKVQTEQQELCGCAVIVKEARRMNE